MKQTKTKFKKIKECSNILLPEAFWCVNYAEVEGRALVWYLAAVEDPKGTQYGWVIWSGLWATTWTDQSRLETKTGSVLFLLRHEREEFSINLFHLVLWSFYQTVFQLSCFSESPPLGAPCLFSRYQSWSGGICVLDSCTLEYICTTIHYGLARHDCQVRDTLSS